MADRPETAPWTIKAVPTTAREKANRYAKMAGVTMGEWIPLAIDAQADRQDGTSVIPSVGPVADSGKLAAPTVSLSDVAATLQAMAAAAHAGLTVSPRATSAVMAVVRQHMAVSRGLPGRSPSRRNGQTIEQSSVDRRDPDVTG